MKHEAIGLIQDEHRSLAAVIHGAEYLADRATRIGKPPDFKLLHAMLYYIREFPERRHHPSEDRVLFARIRSRTHEVDAVLDELDEEHQRGEAMLNALTLSISRWEAGAKDGAQRFAATLREFAGFYWKHMEKEEKQVLPAAQRALTEEDWRAVAEAFRTHGDPMLGGDRGDEFRELFSRIVRLAPAPIGLGDPET